MLKYWNSAYTFKSAAINLKWNVYASMIREYTFNIDSLFISLWDMQGLMGENGVLKILESNHH